MGKRANALFAGALVWLLLLGVSCAASPGEAAGGKVSDALAGEVRSDIAVRFAPGTEPEFPALVAEYIGAELGGVSCGAKGLTATFRVSASQLDDYALFFYAAAYASLKDGELRRRARALTEELLARAGGPQALFPGAPSVDAAMPDSLTVRFHDVEPETLAAFDAVFGVSTVSPLTPLTITLVHVPRGSAYLYHRLLLLSPYVQAVSLTTAVTPF